MAYFVETGDSVLVNVTGAVGSKEVGTGLPAPNNPNDVSLTHFFLSAVYGKTSLVPKDIDVMLTLTNIALDKRAWNHPDIVKQIAKLIRKFQQHRNQKAAYPPLFVDGRIDAMRGTNVVTSITHTKYTIVSLQAGYAESRGYIDSYVLVDLRDLMKEDPSLNTYPHLKQELFRD